MTEITYVYRKSKRRILMGEENWAEYQKDRIKKKSREQSLKKSKYIAEYRRLNKQKLIEYKGGKCQKCGYNKPIPGAYHFHHRDPSIKLFGISQKGWTMNLESLKLEADKCDLLCANCHAEVHDGEALYKLNYPDKPTYRTKEQISKECIRCKDRFITVFPNQVYCTAKCRNRLREEVLVALNNNAPIDIHDVNLNWRREPKVSIRKVIRPSKEELHKLLWTKPTTEIAKIYGVSDTAVGKWAKYYRISKPPRGYWTKIKFNKLTNLSMV